MQLVHKRSVGLGQQYGLLDERVKTILHTGTRSTLARVPLGRQPGSKFLNIGKKVFFFLLDKATKIF